MPDRSQLLLPGGRANMINFREHLTLRCDLECSRKLIFTVRTLIFTGRMVGKRRPHPRSTAPTRSAATATAASRTAVASAAVSVRSGALTTMANASDLWPAPTCPPA